MICPFLDLADARCESHFKLDHLADAFNQCFGHHRSCPVFLRLQREHGRQALSARPAVAAALQPA